MVEDLGIHVADERLELIVWLFALQREAVRQGAAAPLPICCGGLVDRIALGAPHTTPAFPAQVAVHSDFARARG